jgi:hypothetical protein
MNVWLLIGIGFGALAALVIARAIRIRHERRHRPRVVELPNSHYTSKLVLDRDAHDRWRAIPLESVHEINRGEIRALLARIDEYGIDRLTSRERAFLDRMAELNPPLPGSAAPASREPRPENDPVWPDPFGFQPPLGSRPGGR